MSTFQVAPIFVTVVRDAVLGDVLEATQRRGLVGGMPAAQVFPVSAIQIIRDSQMRGSTVTWNAEHTYVRVMLLNASKYVRKVYLLDPAANAYVRQAKAFADALIAGIKALDWTQAPVAAEKPAKRVRKSRKAAVAA